MMAYACIDESGYTGRDLLSEQQPFLALSALFITEDEAASLKHKYFPSLQAPELKHKSLAKQRRNWQALLDMQHECLENYRGISYVVGKRYFCILKFPNDCVEPVFHANGIDFYENGHNLRLASCLYFAGPQSFGSDNFDQLLRLYQQASMSKERSDIDALCGHASTLADRELGECLLPIANYHPAFIAELTSSKTNTNPAFSILFGLISQLELSSGGAYTIIHDTSPAMSDYHAGLKSLMQIDTPRSFAISDIAGLSFPLNLQGIEEADSMAVVGLQLADVMAGGAVLGAMTLSDLRPNSEYGSSVLELYSDSNLIHLIPNIDQQEIAELFVGNDSSSLIDFIAAALHAPDVSSPENRAQG